MGKTFSTDKQKETAVLVAIAHQEQDRHTVEEYLDELAFLTSTLGVETVKTYTQKLNKPDKATFIGKGKLEEVMAYVEAEAVDMVIFDDDLSPSQLRNLENKIKCKIYDRSLLILDIFLERAQTAQAKTQVELARYQYLMPRLTRMWTHLERQRGGTGTRGGAGEKEIETDRRNIRNQINVLKKKLEKIEKQNATQRKSRNTITRVALVGYTNVGKSSLMQLLSKANVKAEDKLFATVDATVRKVSLGNIPFLLSDTVGFIRKLPHHLIESFKSTLNEVREADVLLHVVDASHPAYENHIEVVHHTLAELGAAEKPTLMVFNKIDLLKTEAEWEMQGGVVNGQMTLEALNAPNAGKGFGERVFVSAHNKENMDVLREKILEKVTAKHLTIFPNYLKDNHY